MTAAAGEIILHAGQFHFGLAPACVRTVLGTCVAITLWHPQRRLGGMCHFMLPYRRRDERVDRPDPGFYADEVMSLFAEALLRVGSRTDEYVARIFGGGNMFPTQLTNEGCRRQVCDEAVRRGCHNVGCQNIVAARRLLGERGYQVVSEDVGGHGSRQVAFDLSSGRVNVFRGPVIHPVQEKAS